MGNYGIFLIMGNAGFIISSTVVSREPVVCGFPRLSVCL